MDAPAGPFGTKVCVNTIFNGFDLMVMLEMMIGFIYM